MMKFTVIAVISLAAVTPFSAFAHSIEWYAANLPEARATNKQCMEQLKQAGTLSKVKMEECQRASTALVHATNFVPSKPVSY
ncbi:MULTISPECIES: hypothetical protein [unclassified Paraburkholderia]|uniref:hypothetical protein n=1 Tax=unclassified Paraburkholderia TaxID=2615204 RepID=UPI00104722CD|nr:MULTISPECIES: hypothetical protein [unclassified Paraburkholderia]